VPANQENLSPPRDAISSLLFEILHVLLEGLTAHSIAGHHADLENFQQNIRRLEQQAKAPSLSELLAMARNMTRALQDYNRDTNTHIRTQLQELRQGIRNTAESPVPPCRDALTGLEPRDAAERALAIAMEKGGPFYAVLFLVNRVHLINARFGYASGDQVLLMVRDQLTSFLLPGDLFFRWSGPAFVALVRRTASAAQIQAGVNRITNARMETTVQIGNRSVLLPVACSSHLFPLTTVGGIAALTQAMDAFVGQQAQG